ncbi:MAG: 2-phospho-L-lactate guanylyltransferase [Thermoleophilia bacterium]
MSAVIPVKPLPGALGRLAGRLDAPRRRLLQEAMLGDVLSACAAAEGLGEVIVVTADPDVAALVRAGGARVVRDHDPPRGMNAAVVVGLVAAADAGADAALVLTADLPLAGAADIEAVLRAAPGASSAVLVPSRDGTGTNAMLLTPPGALRPELGPHSLRRHLAQAARRGLTVRRLDVPGLALDIDTPQDLAALVASGRSCAARTVAQDPAVLAAGGTR